MIKKKKKKKSRKKSITSIDNSVKRRKATSTGLGPQARPRGLSRSKNAHRSSTRCGSCKARPCLGLADRRVLNPHQKGSSSREAKPGVAVIMGSEQWENASAKKEQAKDEQKRLDSRLQSKLLPSGRQQIGSAKKAPGPLVAAVVLRSGRC